MMFRDRSEAGRQLGAAVAARRLGAGEVVVLGLPRGGVPVAYEVASALSAPLDVIVVRKVGVPHQPELAMGAVGEDGVEVADPRVLQMAGVGRDELAALAGHERQELNRQVARFVGDRARVPLAGRTAVVVDDGVATGATARVACLVARARGADRVVLAVPVASESALAALREVTDDVVCLGTPEPFYAVGQFYDDFRQIADDEVLALLHRAAVHQPVGVPDGGAAAPGAPGGPGDPGRPAGATDPAGTTDRHRAPDGCDDQPVDVDLGPVRLPGTLVVPPAAAGVVVFAHGSGSSRFSPRNRWVAGTLNRAGFATLLFDLLTPAEELDRERVFDIDLLAGRLVSAVRWLADRPGTSGLRAGLFGASTGAAAALCAAADPTVDVAAVVSRGGRPDLAGARLADVRVPVLLVVGGADEVVLELNRRAEARLGGEHRLVVVPGATHLFEEPGALAQVADLASDWFRHHLVPACHG